MNTTVRKILQRCPDSATTVTYEPLSLMNSPACHPVNQPRNVYQVLDSLLSDVKDSEPELVGEHQSRRRQPPRHSRHLARPRFPLCAVRSWAGPSQGTFLTYLAVLTFLPGSLHTNHVSQLEAASLSSPTPFLSALSSVPQVLFLFLGLRHLSKRLSCVSGKGPHSQSTLPG